ncbi:hypothetical protein [Methanobrevibacter curvatus]|uniref:Uncharacterized protein n=1 Tax=Methanobrevibacter curvatus TaxID=49547 RepID=A0A162FH36_9EURY|nr:hypothetical protein [Methanobrevibacter curvatus]KZX12965.1 hypothetical protein MBCUR_07910 [Methanobrevibacter curvatus]
MNKKNSKTSNFGYFNKNLLDSFSTVDLYKNIIFYNKNQIIKNNNSLFYIFNNSKNINSKIYADKLSVPETCSSDDNDTDEDEPSDSINLGNRFIFYFNSFETSNEFYKILDNTKFYGNLTPLKTSTFDILESYKSYSNNTDYLSNEITSFEIVDIRNDSINFGIMTDYSNLLNTDYSSFLNFNNHVINQDYFNSCNDLWNYRLEIIVYNDNIFTNFYNATRQSILTFVYSVFDMEVSQ